MTREVLGFLCRLQGSRDPKKKIVILMDAHYRIVEKLNDLRMIKQLHIKFKLKMGLQKGDDLK